MSDHFDQSIAALQEKVREAEAELIKRKQSVNMLAEVAGRPRIYQDAELNESAGLETVRSDTFYGQPLNGSAKRVLEMRKAAGLGPATVKEIYDVLKKGGYQITASSEKNAIDGLRISLGKGSHTFHKLPDGSYGLLAWYPNVKTKRAESDDEDAADHENDKPETPSKEPK